MKIAQWAAYEAYKEARRQARIECIIRFAAVTAAIGILVWVILR